MHLSTKRSLEAVERARRQSVYVETCPQYLLLDDHLYDAPNFEAKNMSAHRHYANERINRLCGKELKRAINTYRQITAVLISQWDAGVETRPEFTEGVAKGRITLEKWLLCFLKILLNNSHGQKQLAKMILVKFPMGCQVLKRDQLIYTEGVAKGRITLEKMVALLSENIYNSRCIQKGVVRRQ